MGLPGLGRKRDTGKERRDFFLPCLQSCEILGQSGPAALLQAGCQGCLAGAGLLEHKAGRKEKPGQCWLHPDKPGGTKGARSGLAAQP